MALSDIDRQLLDRCLNNKPQAWQDFVDRFMGLVIHVVNHTADSRSVRLHPSDVEDYVSDVFLEIIADDFRVLRRFRRESSLATYLTVIARRVIARELTKHLANGARQPTPAEAEALADPGAAEQRMDDREEVERLINRLESPEAEVVRMYHLEGKTYGEISQETGMPTNSVGPTLSRARSRLRGGAQPAG